MLQRIAKLLGVGTHCGNENRSTRQCLAPVDRLAGVETESLDDPPVRHSAGRPTRMDRLHRLPLAKLGLFGPLWRERLGTLCIDTAAQFMNVSGDQWRQWGMTAGEIRKLRRWQEAVRLASTMPSMKPYEAMMLFAIHRRRLSRLAGELPGRLHRDLMRFALSSRGKKLLRSRKVPDRQQVAAWIEAARLASGAQAPRCTP